MVDVNNTRIKIPESHYVGFNKRGDNEVPLGFMTPDGTDSAAQKRKTTVDNWASRGYYGAYSKPTLPAKTFENKPLSGFKMGQNVRHGYGWGQGNVKWRIEDPRGFELEISSPNLAQIMAITTIENGEILDKCIWGRLGSENILIPITSEVYKTAEANTKRLNSSASAKDLKVGYNVVLQNGIEGRYLGSHYVIQNKGFALKQSSKKKHYILTGETTIEIVTTLKLSSIKNSDELTTDEALTIINKKDNKMSEYNFVCALNKPLKTVKYALKDLNINSINSQDRYVVAKIDDDYACVNTWYIGTNHSYRQNMSTGTLFDKEQLLTEGKFEFLTEYQSYSYSYSYYGRTNKVNKCIQIDVNDQLIDWYEVVVEITSENLNFRYVF